MSKLIQLRNVPHDLHRVLEARAALEAPRLRTDRRLARAPGHRVAVTLV